MKNRSTSSFIIFCLECVDISQVQCIKSYKAQEHDELTLEKADILHAKTITSDGERRLWWKLFSPRHLLVKNTRAVLSLREVVFLQAGWTASDFQTGNGAGSPKPTLKKSQVAARASATFAKISASNASRRNWRGMTEGLDTVSIIVSVLAWHVNVTHILDVNACRNLDCRTNKSTVPHFCFTSYFHWGTFTKKTHISYKTAQFCPLNILTELSGTPKQQSDPTDIEALPVFSKPD